MSTLFTSGQRLILLRQKLGLSQKKLSDLTGISRSYINDVEAGRSNPSANMVSQIASKTDVNIAWLMTGEGEMFRSETGTRAGVLPEKEEDLDRCLAALKGVLGGLPKEVWDVIVKEAFARAQTEQQIADLRQTVSRLQRSYQSKT